MRDNRGSLFAGLGIALFVATSAAAGDADLQNFTQIERGRYLAVLSDCVSCHTVPGSQPAVRRRARDRNPLRQYPGTEHHARSGDRNRKLER